MARIPFTSSTRVPEGVLMRDLGGEAVVLHLPSQAYFGLDVVGARTWTLLAASPSIQAAFDSLLAEYDVDPGVLRADLEEFVAELVAKGLLETRA